VIANKYDIVEASSLGGGVQADGGAKLPER